MKQLKQIHSWVEKVTCRASFDNKIVMLSEPMFRKVKTQPQICYFHIGEVVSGKTVVHFSVSYSLAVGTLVGWGWLLHSPNNGSIKRVWLPLNVLYMSIYSTLTQSAILFFTPIIWSIVNFPFICYHKTLLEFLLRILEIVLYTLNVLFPISRSGTVVKCLWFYTTFNSLA